MEIVNQNIIQAEVAKLKRQSYLEQRAKINTAVSDLLAKKKQHTASLAANLKTKADLKLMSNTPELLTKKKVLRYLIQQDKMVLKELKSKLIRAKLIKVAMGREIRDYLRVNGGFKDLKKGKDPWRVRAILREKGKPMLLSDIVGRLGYPPDVGNKGKHASLRSTLTHCAQINRVFTIESIRPHVIGLREFVT